MANIKTWASTPATRHAAKEAAAKPKAWTCIVKMYSGSPLMPCKGADGKPVRFKSKAEADAYAGKAERKGKGGSMAGGGPYYFVQPVHDEPFGHHDDDDEDD